MFSHIVSYSLATLMTADSPKIDLPKEASTGPIFHPDWGTHAYASYNASTTGLDALLALVLGFEQDDEAIRAARERERTAIENAFSGPWAIDLTHTMLSWQVAMRVSAVEVYLQDALTFLAVYDPEFIRSRGSTQSWDYDAARMASDDGTVVWGFCGNWARAFIGDGGPAKWARSLEGSGLGRFAADDVAALEAMWGYRHLRIHNSARFSPEFVRRHPAVAERLWRDGLARADFDSWRETADRFVTAAETGIAGRLRARLGEALIKGREQAEMDRQFAVLEARLWKNLLAEHPEAEERYEVVKGDDTARRALMYELLGFADPAVDSPLSGPSHKSAGSGEVIGES